MKSIARAINNLTTFILVSGVLVIGFVGGVWIGVKSQQTPLVDDVVLKLLPGMDEAPEKPIPDEQPSPPPSPSPVPLSIATPLPAPSPSVPSPSPVVTEPVASPTPSPTPTPSPHPKKKTSVPRRVGNWVSDAVIEFGTGLFDRKKSE